jgi:hypothetical protein
VVVKRRDEMSVVRGESQVGWRKRRRREDDIIKSAKIDRIMIYMKKLEWGGDMSDSPPPDWYDPWNEEASLLYMHEFHRSPHGTTSVKQMQMQIQIQIQIQIQVGQ